MGKQWIGIKKSDLTKCKLQISAVNPLGIRQLTTDAVDRAKLVFTLEHLLILTGQYHQISTAVTI